MTEPKNMRVLAIDDDEMALTIIRKMLEPEGFAVDVCFSARTALDQLPITNYDAVLCDMWMPGMTGSEFYQRVRETYPDYRGKIIFITGDIASEATWDFIDQRRLPYVLKPFSLVELKKKLQEVVGDWRAPLPPPPPDPNVNRRKHRRVAMKATVRVRKKKWASAGPDIASVVNASKEGVYFTTEQEYRVGTDVWVAFPYTGANDVEQDGFIVRVEKRPDGKKGIAIAIGEAAGRSRNAILGSEEERRRNKILAMADLAKQTPTLDVVSEEFVDSAEEKARLMRERDETRRLAEELADLKATYESVESQRDRLASEESDLRTKLMELTAAKSAMTEVIGDLKSQMEQLQEQLVASEAFRYQATHDSLTGVWNRAAIMDILKRELARVRREGSSMALIVADLDHFKSVNDTHGHAAGDIVLQEAARRMVAAVRDYDAVGRYGGEEFLIIIAGCDDENAFKQADRIREKLCAEEMAAGDVRLRVTTSMGVVTSNLPGEAEDLFKTADAALYRAKRGGRNRVEVGTAADVRAGAATDAAAPKAAAPVNG